nr:dna (cytosine-5)-methyltransferase 1 [Quercus suber]
MAEDEDEFGCDQELTAHIHQWCIASAAEAVGSEQSVHEEAADEMFGQDPDSERADGKQRKGIGQARDYVRQGEKRRVLSHVGHSIPGFPRSAYAGWEPPLPRVREGEALPSLLATAARERRPSGEEQSFKDYETFLLEDYSIYRPVPDAHHHATKQPHKGRSRELVSLDQLLQKGCPELLFDGVLVRAATRFYVQGVAFKTLVVDGYGTDEVLDTNDKICIQTPTGQSSDAWYQLGTPSSVYTRFDRPFRWVVQFTKFFIDFLLDHDNITLEHFRQQFYQSISSKHAGTPTLQAWLSQCSLRDFRTVVNANIDFLHKEWCGIHLTHQENDLYRHPIWDEVLTHRLRAIPRQDEIEKKTIVTPFVADCFKNMYFADQMETRPILDEAVRSRVRRLKCDLKLTPFDTSPRSQYPSILTPDSLSEDADEDDSTIKVNVGDVVCYLAEEDGQWNVGSHPVWYAYVQRVWTKSKGGNQQTLLDVIWLYHPRDTTMRNIYYPYENELFMSDNCSCGREALPLEDIVGTAKVSFFEQNPSVPGLFVRQKFGTVSENDEHYFETLKPSHFACRCDKPHDMFGDCRRRYKTNDTVLTRRWDAISQDNWLEPAQIIAFDANRRTVRLRELRRAVTENAKAASNELILTEHTFSANASDIIRKCHVLFLEETEIIPLPYDRGGTGDLFFIRHHNIQISLIRQRSADTEQLPLPRQGWRPSEKNCAPLKGLGIFCGGGNLDRGLEEGGVVRFTHAVDHASIALHSYRANHEDPTQTQLFLGSVNDYIARAMAGYDSGRRGDIKIAKPGDIEVLSAGSPCPGFSAMQRDKLSEESRRNASMVASVISYVDLYCPRYLFLENVVEMTFPAGPNKDQNVFGQIIASLVALGYQVQQFLMDAWTVGSSQRRSRIFIAAAAPDMPTLDTPPYTHAHPANQKLNRSLGKGANGKAFGSRRNEDVPFRQMSVADAIDDLPNIGDSMPQICPQFPDHRVPVQPAVHHTTRFAMIPVIPEGSSLVKAGQRCDWLLGEPLQCFQGLNAIRSLTNSNTLSRVVPSDLFSCVMTVLRVMDCRGGRTLHPTQHRSLSVMELKRAQGVLDHEVIIGTMPEQIKVIGNMVDRKVSLALGLSLRQSLDVPSIPQEPETLPVVTSTTRTSVHRNVNLATPISLSVDEQEEIDDAHRDAILYEGNPPARLLSGAVSPSNPHILPTHSCST